MFRRLWIVLMLLLAVSMVPSGLSAAAAAGSTYIVNGYVSDTGGNPGDDVKLIEPYNESYSRFIDYANGYSVLFPAHMTVDSSLSAVRVVFSDERTRIEVYRDDFAGTATSADDIQYGNRYVQGSPWHAVQADYWTETGGLRTHVLQWSRKALARVADDKNYLLSAEVIKNSQEVYTIFIKSADPIGNAGTVIDSFRTFPRQGQARNFKRYTSSATVMNDETKAFYQKFFGEKAPLRWGLFEPSAPQSLNGLHELEKTLDYKFPVLLHYQMFDDYFPEWGLHNAYEDGRVVELTLQTTFAGEVNALWAGSRRNQTMLYDILDGKYDEYFNNYAQKLKAFGHPVIFRLDNEMNGDWCWYSAYYYGKDTEIYKALWRYVHDVFERNGVDNVIWVWNPHDPSLPPFAWNHYMMYYPGDEYVDVVGLTGYNTGNYFPGERWREFGEIYPNLYDDYSGLFDKPFMITEFASNSVGGNKPAWINRMFDQIKTYDRIKVAVWWSGVDYDQNGQPGRIYLINEDDAVMDAFRARLKDYKQ